TRDLTAEMRERRAAEQRLAQLQGEMVQANKLATLGQITAGVAHEVNTPLATIRLLAENGRQMLPSDSPGLDRNLAQISRMTDRIAQITTELRGFARKATGQMGPVPLKEALDAALLLTASRRRAQNIRLTLPEIPPGLRVMAETVRLEQILVNLIQNAQEALEGRTDPEIRIALQDDGPMLRLSF
ncbi:sensor histidine kinase, partial [Paracoccus sp. PXZ]